MALNNFSGENTSQLISLAETYALKPTVYSPASTFSFKRFYAYARLFIRANSRKLIMMAALIYIFSTLLLIFNFYASSNYMYENRYPNLSLTDSSRDVMWSSECEVMTFIAIIVSVISGSMMFSALSDRKSRLNTLEIPATQFEKFLTWLIIYLPATIITLWISFYLAQISRVAWTSLFTDFGSYAHIIPFNRIILLHGDFVLSYSDIYESFTTYGAILFLNSFFALGSIFFQKLSFLKSAISGAIISTLIGLSALLGHIAFFGFGGSTTVRYECFDNQYYTSILILCITCILAILCYALSYYRFKQTEIIDRW